MPSCPSCGEQNPERARFCLACGTPLAAEPPRREARRTVTLLFCDVTDSTVLGERIEPESLRRVMTRYFDELRGAIESHGGTVEKFIGDAVMSVFGSPKVHEDDALRGVRAAAEIRERVAVLNTELERDWGISLAIRTGLNTGEVVVDDPSAGQRLVTGDAVNVAARLQGAAAPGEILMGDDTHRLVRNAVLAEPVEALELKGKSAPVEAWRLLAVLVGAPPVARRLDSPLVGRERELTLLREAFERSAGESSCHLFTLLGPAGAGKSRLANELVEHAGGKANALSGRCLPYGEGITFWPVVEIVKRAARLSPGLDAAEARRRIAELVADEREGELIVERLTAIVGLTRGGIRAQDTFWAFRKLLESLARRRPLVIAFDDIHWGEATLLDLIEHVADWARDAPILILCLGRPELLEERPSWGGGKLNATSLLLEPLDHEACGRLVENLLASTPVDGEVKRRIAGAAEGNPLFVEEMLAMLIDDGALREEGGRWRAAGDISAITIPPTIQALLAARLDRLPSDELAVIERAAVAGKVFSRGAVRALHDDQDGHLDERLDALVRKQLIRPHRAVFAGEDTFRFRHILIRDAAYQGMPKDLRADLHERFVAWLRRAGGKSAAEYEEILGYHLEQAHRFRTDLAPADERSRALAGQGAEHLASAARRAFRRGDMPAAVGLFTRASILLRDDEEAAAGLASDFGAALIEMGELERADAVLSRAADVAAASGDERARALALVTREHLRIYTDPGEDNDQVRRLAEEAIEVFAAHGDDRGMAKALTLIAQTHWWRGQFGRMEAVLERALVHAELAGDDREQTVILNGLARTIPIGPRPIADGLERCAEILARADGDRSLEALVASLVAGLEAMRGRFAEARSACARGRDLCDDLGLKVLRAGISLYAGVIELLADDAAAAERELRAGVLALEAMGEKGRQSTAAAMLARAVYEQGRYGEAEELTRISEQAATPEDSISQVMWRQTRAKALARRGRIDEGEAVAREAVELAAACDFLNVRGDGLLDLAEILALAGRGAESRPLIEEAIALYEAKGNVVSRARAEARLQALPAPVST
jgi:predicted ATPase/class 3 adenylate cyclase